MKLSFKHGLRANQEPRQIRAMRGEGHRRFGRHGFGRGEGRHGEGEGRGRRRMFEGGELRLVLLLLLEIEPRHGYDLIREIETRTGRTYAPSPGIIYPTLTLLEEMGLAELRAAKGPKKLYAITEAGIAHLNENRKEAEMALGRLDQLRARGEAIDQGPVFRAISNLRAVLHQKLAKDPGKDVLFSVADIIDEAARKIERL